MMLPELYVSKSVFDSNSIKLVNLCSIFISTWLTAAGFIHLVSYRRPRCQSASTDSTVPSTRWSGKKEIPPILLFLLYKFLTLIAGGELGGSLGKLSEFPGSLLLGMCLPAHGDHVHRWLWRRVC